MKREYRVVDRYRDTSERYVEEFLREETTDGWELVSVCSMRGSLKEYDRFYFKREVPS